VVRFHLVGGTFTFFGVQGDTKGKLLPSLNFFLAALEQELAWSFEQEYCLTGLGLRNLAFGLWRALVLGASLLTPSRTLRLPHDLATSRTDTQGPKHLPSMSEATDTKPSFAPNTPALNQGARLL
jgi:hypothetical protein